MTLSIPGILVSRDGSLRRYEGHSKRTGLLYGRSERDGRGWVVWCALCGWGRRGDRQRDVASDLRDHWLYDHKGVS